MHQQLKVKFTLFSLQRSFLSSKLQNILTVFHDAKIRKSYSYTKYAIHKDDFEKLRVYFVLLQICHKKSLRYYSKTCIKYFEKKKYIILHDYK